MRFWFVHSGDVPIQDQLVTQVSLGILSGELGPGERLPSVRELARRFRIHPNTISLAYQRLQRDRWVVARRGSGIYVRDRDQEVQQPAADQLDDLIRKLIAIAESTGVTPQQFSERVASIVAAPPIAQLILAEPDPDLAAIVIAELAPATSLPIRTCTPDQLPKTSASTLILVLPSKAESLRAQLPPSTKLLVLRIRSVPGSLSEWLPAPTDTLVAIASQWPQFLTIARTMLVAAGFHADTLILRDAREPAWHLGLDQAAAIVCDAFTANLVPHGLRTIEFRLLAPESLAEITALSQQSDPVHTPFVNSI